MPLQEKILGAALGESLVLHSSLCRREAGAFQQAIKGAKAGLVKERNRGRDVSGGRRGGAPTTQNQGATHCHTQNSTQRQRPGKLNPSK